ncbi:ankyrin repeat domain-containing protein [Streptomyces sp. NPDC058252]|uniref:ankyrin repeat domain-containing protein n=1 Tax=Streptomyces sp. NPDC058252 TaxID=3346405 RepID=UPI0036E89173
MVMDSEMMQMADGVERWTPVHQAVEMSDYEGLTILLNDGTDPNEMCFGHTLLTHAIDVEGDGHLQSGHPLNTAATAILSAYGADPRLPAEDGETPLQLAQHYNHKPAERLLQRYLTPGKEEPEAPGEDEDRGGCEAA